MYKTSLVPKYILAQRKNKGLPALGDLEFEDSKREKKKFRDLQTAFYSQNLTTNSIFPFISGSESLRHLHSASQTVHCLSWLITVSVRAKWGVPIYYHFYLFEGKKEFQSTPESCLDHFLHSCMSEWVHSGGTFAWFYFYWRCHLIDWKDNLSSWVVADWVKASVWKSCRWSNGFKCLPSSYISADHQQSQR